MYTYTIYPVFQYWTTSSNYINHNYTYNYPYQDCIKQACVKCCNISTCQPHILAKLENQRKQSILDGTDPITTAANLKRASKVKDNGCFVESNIHYFDETVVLWNVIDFINNS